MLERVVKVINGELPAGFWFRASRRWWAGLPFSTLISRCQAWIRLHRFPLVEITTSGAASVVVIKSGRSEPSVPWFDL